MTHTNVVAVVKAIELERKNLVFLVQRAFKKRVFLDFTFIAFALSKITIERVI